MDRRRAARRQPVGPTTIIGNEVIRSVKKAVSNCDIHSGAANRRTASRAARWFCGLDRDSQQTDGWTARRKCAARGLPHVEHIHPLADGSTDPNTLPQTDACRPIPRSFRIEVGFLYCYT